MKHGDEDFTGYCYDDDLCLNNDWWSATFYYGLNSCCGNSGFSGYYSLTYGGECLSCKECMIANIICSQLQNSKFYLYVFTFPSEINPLYKNVKVNV